ncbi:MAG: 2Fe-2S iron-sulfur cluster binding domain-containing protein [Bacteroidetes bacterium]|nr:2Fe-2S iron-sulfur cluster binding domain-containing protein [Bacteroidota bacterium]
MAKFHKLKISDVRKETSDCVSVAFEIPASLKEEYKFIQGQYLTLKLFVSGEEIRRSYSICSGVHEGELRVAIKRVKEGKGSNFINDNFNVRQEVEVMTPMGGFHSPMNPYHKKNYVLFAGGSGITPMCSIIKTVLHDEPNSTILLFYGNLNEDATIFRKQLNELKDKNSQRLKLFYILDKPQHPIDETFKGIMTGEKVQLLIVKFVDMSKDNEFFICGPTPMMDNVRKVLEDLAAEKNKIHIEYFTSSSEPVGATIAPLLEKIISQVTVSQYGVETSFKLSSDGKAILDAAIEHGVDAPFACKGAVCATCRAKLLEGKVHMNKNFALTDSEVKEGYILTCQSHPLTPVVKVDYDM